MVEHSSAKPKVLMETTKTAVLSQMKRILHYSSGFLDTFKLAPKSNSLSTVLKLLECISIVISVGKKIIVMPFGSI